MQLRAYRIGDLSSTPGSAGLLPVSPATVWRWVRSGKFPKPYKLGDRVTLWDAVEVDEFLNAQRRAAEVTHG